MYKKILFSVDLNDDASWQKALPAALQHCQAFGAELHVLTVVPELPMGVVNLYFADDAGARLVKAAKEDLADFVSKRIPAGFPVKRHVAHGTIYTCILDAADAIDADLIIMASHRPAMRDYLLGPNAARVVRHSTRSVLVVRA
jgi:nucleotide-binding universal stress UspA family protein